MLYFYIFLVDPGSLYPRTYLSIIHELLGAPWTGDGFPPNRYELTVQPGPSWKNELTGPNNQTFEDSKSISEVLKNKIQLGKFKNLIDFI